MRLGDQAGWGGKVSRQQVDKPGLQGSCADFEQDQRHRQFETPPASTAGIEVEAVVAPFDQGLVRMAGDDQFDVVSEQGGNVGDVVSEQGWPAVEVQGEVVGDIGGPREGEIVITAHDVERGNRGEMAEDLGRTDVTGMEDKVAALDSGQGFGAEEAVGVGDEGGFHGERF